MKSSGIKLKNNMGYEALVSQIQPWTTDKILCVQDGLYLQVFDLAGPFPLALRFEHKQKRYGWTEYYFRCQSDETLYCVFGREHAELFCSGYVDEENTDSERSEDSEGNLEEQDASTELFSSSSEKELLLEPEVPEQFRKEAETVLQEHLSLLLEDKPLSASDSFRYPEDIPSGIPKDFSLGKAEGEVLPPSSSGESVRKEYPPFLPPPKEEKTEPKVEVLQMDALAEPPGNLLKSVHEI